MRIILGSILLATAFAAPVDFEHATLPPITYPSDGVDQTEATTPWHEREQILDAGIDVNSPQYEPMIRKWLRSTGLPEQAIEEYIEGGFHVPPITDEKMRAGEEWERKWVLKEYATSPPIATASAGMGNTEATTQPTFEGAQSVDDDTVNVEVVSPDEEAFNTAMINNEPILRQGMRAQGLPEKAIDEFIAGGFHLAPVTDKKIHEVFKWQQKWKAHIRTPTEDELRKIMGSAGIPEHAIEEYITSGYHLPLTKENELSALIWALKYTPKNVSVGAFEKAVRQQFEARGAPKEAVDEFIAGGFHLGFSEEKEQAFKEWVEKWSKMAATDATTATPVEVTTTVLAKFSDDQIRRSLEIAGYSEEAIEEFFAAGIAKQPSDDVTEARYGEWLKKWQRSTEEIAYARSHNIIDEVTNIFRTAYQATSLLQMFAHDVPITAEKMQKYKPIFEAIEELPKFERELIEKVMLHATNNVYKKLGVEGLSDEE